MKRRRAIGFLGGEDDRVEREVRRSEADWRFIEAQPPKIKAALKLFIETGDLRLAQSLAGLDLEDFVEVLRRARVPAFINVRP